MRIRCVLLLLPRNPEPRYSVMKTKLFVLYTFCTLSFYFPCSLLAEEFTLGGSLATTIATNTTPNPDSFHVNDIGFMLRPSFCWKKDAIKLFTEIDFAQADIDGSNYLKEAWVGFTDLDSGRLELRFGRIPTAWIKLTPHPKDQQTVFATRTPGNIFAWGAKAIYTIVPWTYTLDITGDTLASFQSIDSFNDPEVSIRVCYKGSEHWYTGLTGMFGADGNRTAIDVSLKYPEWELVCVGYAESRQNLPSNHTHDIGSYIYTGYTPQILDSKIEFHALLDVQNRNGAIGTFGVRWFLSNKTDLTADIFSSKEENFGAAIRLRTRL